MGIFDKLFGKNQIKVWQKWMEGQDYIGNPQTCCSSPSIDKLVQKHGVAEEVHADEHDLDSCVVHVIFADGQEYIVSGESRYIKGGPTFGYSGTGPSLFEAFLIMIGFDITADEIKKMRAPITLRRGQYRKAEKI